MASTAPQYQKATTFDLPPNTILLGSIIRSPKYPDEALNQGEIVSITPTPIPLTHYNWKDTVENVKKGKIGFFARFFQSVAVGAEVGAGGNNAQGYDYSFEKLETVSFFPNQAYLEKAIQTPQMVMWLEGARYPPVYMVTGIKVARGVSSTVKTKIAKTRESHANVGIFATIFTIPIKFGPNGKGSTLQKQEVSFGGPPITADSAECADFVVGYRLRKLTFEEKDGEQMVESEYFLEGNMMGEGNNNKEISNDSGMVVSGFGDATEEELEWEKCD